MFLNHGGLSTVFEVWRTSSVTTDMGRVLQNSPKKVGELRGTLAVATSSEKERWGQLSHPVSHKVILRGVPEISLLVGDILRWESCGAMRELILNKIPYDVGGLGHYILIYGDERRDLSC